jgi:hypothetical protein
MAPKPKDNVVKSQLSLKTKTTLPARLTYSFTLMRRESELTKLTKRQLDGKKLSRIISNKISIFSISDVLKKNFLPKKIL